MCAGYRAGVQPRITPTTGDPSASPSPASTRAWDNGGDGRPSRDRHDPRRPGSYQFLDARGPGHLRREGQEPAQPAVELLRPARALLPTAPARWCRRPRPSSGSSPGTRSRRSSSSSTSSSGTSPASTSGCKDDKSYPYLAVTLDEEWPRAMVLRGSKRKGVRYFGPYAHAYAIRETLDLLLRTFPIRTCTKNEVRPAPPARPAVPATRTSRSARRRASATSTTTSTTSSSQELLDFLDGEHDAVIAAARAADARGVRPARVRARGARCATSSRACARRSSASRWSAAREEDFDLIGLAEDPLEASVQVFFVRRGRVVGRKGLIVDKVEDVETPALVATHRRAALRRRAAGRRARRRSSCPCEPEDLELYEEFLDAATAGSKVRIRVPQRGGKRELLETVDAATRRESFARHKLRRASDHNARARALVALQEALDLPEAPLRIECFDISQPPGHRDRRVDGRDGGRAAEALRLPPLQGQDARRPGRLRVDGRGADPPVPQLPRASATRARTPGKRFAYPPNLLLVDGGKGQLNVAVRVLEELGLEDICVASLAKRFEEVYLPGRSRAGPHPARLRGALPAAAGARRGAPLRDHVPPPAARQEDDDVGARRRPRPRPDPPEAAAARSSAR